MRSWLKVALFLLLCGQISLAMAAEKEGLPRAWELNRQGEYNSSLRIFQAIQRDPSSTPAQKLQALFGEAHLWNYRPDYPDKEKARTLYAEVIAKAPPGDPLIAWSDFESVQSRHLEAPSESRDYTAIAKSYLGVYQRQPGTPAGDEAFLTYILIRQGILKTPPAEVLKDCQDFIQARPDSPWLSTFYGAETTSYEDLKEPRKAVESIISSADAAQKATPGVEVDNSDNFWQVGYLAEFELGDFTLAREYYGKLIADYPNDQRVFPAQQALARMDVVEAALREGRPVPADPRKWSRPFIQL